ncbi:MAG: NAD(P)/FAD-dependent oxidoreductase [Nitrososphaeria archaeon]
MESPLYDVIIIGAGASGLTAGIYSCRRSLKTLIVSKDIGGQALVAKEIENYPGVPRSSGAELIQKIFEQAQRFGAEITLDEVKLVAKEAEGRFKVETRNAKYLSKAVIIASGKVPRDLKVAGEERFKGSGVSYCATCDAPLYRNKKVAVVGDGDFAYDAAIILSKYAAEVLLISKKEALVGERGLLELIKRTKNIVVLLGTSVREIKGTYKVTAVVLESDDKGVYEIGVDGVFVEMGFEVNVEPFKGLVKLDNRKQIVVNNRNETTMEGVFASGDATDTPFKQFVISAAEGAKAALSAYEYIQSLAGRSAVTVDWHK